MENYIVRIYRREANDPNSVVGTVECVETQLHRAFHGLGKLGALLTHPGIQDDPESRPSDQASIRVAAIRTSAIEE